MPGTGSFRRGIGALVLAASVVVMLSGCAWLRGSSVRKASFENHAIGTAYRDGENAVKNGDYVKARRVLMQIISAYPGENDLAQVQWLIAYSYELEGRVDQAIAEYKRFLRNFPTHPNAPDAEDRLRRLEQGLPPAVQPSRKAVRFLGALSTDYEYATQMQPDPQVTLHRVSTRLDLQIRDLHDGLGKIVFSGLHTKGLEDERDDRARLYRLYGDWRNRADTLTLRAGRQPGTPGGLSTRYDGIEMHYRPARTASLDAAAGFPIDFTTRTTPSWDAYFYEVGVTLIDLRGLTGRAYAVRQLARSVIEREAAGGNVQAVWGRFGLVANVDYDFQFDEFNDRFVSLDYEVATGTRLIVSQDMRKDPYLQLSTSLQDPAAVGLGLDEWIALQGEDAVRESARFRTIDSIDRRIGIRWLNGATWSAHADYAHGSSEIGQLDATGAIVRTVRTYDRLSLYVSHNGWRVPDTASLLLIHQTSTDVATESLYLTVGDRLSRWANLQLKGRIESTTFDVGNADTVRYVPGLILTVEPARMFSLTTEAEYVWEDRRDDATLTSLFVRANITVAF